VLNGFIIDIGIHNYCDSEIEEAKAQITALKDSVGERPVLIMFDRNYASLEIVDFLEKSGVKYLIRLRSADSKAERARMKSKDETIEPTYTKHRLRRLKKEAPLRAAELERRQSVRVRIIKTIFDGGEEAALMTNLGEGSAVEIKRLYRKRRSIERKYHTLKNKLKFESVTGKASDYVKQDFWAQMLVSNMAQDLINAAECRAAKRAKKKRLKYEIRINENIAIGLFKEKFIRLIMEEDDCRKDGMFRSLTADMERYTVPIRKLKSSPRKWKYFNKYKANLKPSF
jgi:IS4 transposase